MIFPLLNIPILIVSSVIVDVEPFLLSLQHGFFHSYLGATIVGLSVAVASIPLRNSVEWISTHLVLLPQKVTFRNAIFTSLFGVWLHVFLDSFLYPEMKPFLPFEGNPFLGLVSSAMIYEIAFLSFVPAFALYLLKLYLRARKTRKDNIPDVPQKNLQNWSCLDKDLKYFWIISPRWIIWRERIWEIL
jgi:membrane-bound metal-dependent hydrolase YbcI (DUF457 family)